MKSTRKQKKHRMKSESSNQKKAPLFLLYLQPLEEWALFAVGLQTDSLNL